MGRNLISAQGLVGTSLRICGCSIRRGFCRLDGREDRGLGFVWWSLCLEGQGKDVRTCGDASDHVFRRYMSYRQQNASALVVFFRSPVGFFCNFYVAG